MKMTNSNQCTNPQSHNPWDNGILWRLQFAVGFQLVAIGIGIIGFLIFTLILGRNPIEEAFGEKMLIYDGLITLGTLFIISLLCAGNAKPKALENK